MRSTLLAMATIAGLSALAVAPSDASAAPAALRAPTAVLQDGGPVQTVQFCGWRCRRWHRFHRWHHWHHWHR